ncbi:unnamed protein product [Linum trigynum]|uniref:Uncharacterized protein n=1 Tax=Linum trigynum TaxID=586398 RepID=A0AAV2G7U4_9ROSI
MTKVRRPMSMDAEASWLSAGLRRVGDGESQQGSRRTEQAGWVTEIQIAATFGELSCWLRGYDCRGQRPDSERTRGDEESRRVELLTARCACLSSVEESCRQGN